MPEFEKSLFIFRRDLRLDDNTGLMAAMKASRQVVPCFIFDPRQVEGNPYRSDNCVQFMIESLQDLEVQLAGRKGKLHIFYGPAEKIIEGLLRDEGVRAVFVNRDYTPFSIQRDLRIKDACTRHGVRFISCADCLLNEPEHIGKNDGGVYTVYTPFFRKCREFLVRKPEAFHFGNFYTKPVAAARKNVYTEILPAVNGSLAAAGGRAQGLKILSAMRRFKDYDTERNLPAVEGTSKLSAHNKFGTVSIREVYHAVSESLGGDHTMISELYWRDFFTHVGFHYPYVLGQPFREKYAGIKWNKSKADFDRWCGGTTGFPLVDAGMRELNTTGFMHNRVRMVVASFLVKDLHIDWRWGEKYFAQKLVDYDPLVNNGNWQWAASTGCDAQPYFRIFNPWRQQERFDPDCRYIKKWLPELANVASADIHKWEKVASPILSGYPVPMCDHAKESRKSKDMFRL